MTAWDTLPWIVRAAITLWAYISIGGAIIAVLVAIFQGIDNDR